MSASTIQRGVRQCPARGCPRLLLPETLMCGGHWHRVPRILQRELWEQYSASTKHGRRPRFTARYLDLRQQALRFAEATA